MMSKLRPCPFCGKQPTITPYFINGVANKVNHFAQCSCGVKTRSRKNCDGALDDWNTRPLEDEQAKLIESMGTLLMAIHNEDGWIPANGVARMVMVIEQMKNVYQEWKDKHAT
jgi:hypothetical protein